MNPEYKSKQKQPLLKTLISLRIFLSFTFHLYDSQMMTMSKFHSLNDSFHKIVHHWGKAASIKSLGWRYTYSARFQKWNIHCKIFFEPTFNITLFHISFWTKRYRGDRRLRYFDEKSGEKKTKSSHWMITHPSLPFRSRTVFLFFLSFSHSSVPHNSFSLQLFLRHESNGWETGNPVTFNEDKRSLVYWNFPKDKVKRVQVCVCTRTLPSANGRTNDFR